MNKLITPHENQLIGKWELTENGVITDAVTRRIEFLIENELVEIARSDDGWSVLYKDNSDGRYWELSFPESGSHGGGPPTLTNLSFDESKAKFRF